MIPIAKPLASEETQEKIIELASERDRENKLRTGIKACQKAVKECAGGLLVLTADTTPMDLISHLPVLCEECGVKYVFIEKKKLLPKSYTCVFLESKEDDSKMGEILGSL
jgi:H/ACA ribonucleoprotein complex subunit 2